jgi:hypothetical protein
MRSDGGADVSNARTWASFKVCTGCGLEYRETRAKPMTTYFWRQSREPDGLRKRCKLCNQELPCMVKRIAKARQ